jgi:hypothetical protein
LSFGIVKLPFCIWLVISFAIASAGVGWFCSLSWVVALSPSGTEVFLPPSEVGMSVGRTAGSGVGLSLLAALVLFLVLEESIFSGLIRKPALSYQAGASGSCLVVSNWSLKSTWNCGLTSPVVQSSTSVTFLPWRGNWPRYMPIFDHSFHLWNGDDVCSVLARTFTGHPNG